MQKELLSTTYKMLKLKTHGIREKITKPFKDDDDKIDFVTLWRYTSTGQCLHALVEVNPEGVGHKLVRHYLTDSVTHIMNLAKSKGVEQNPIFDYWEVLRTYNTEQLEEARHECCKFSDMLSKKLDDDPRHADDKTHLLDALGHVVWAYEHLLKTSVGFVDKYATLRFYTTHASNFCDERLKEPNLEAYLNNYTVYQDPR